MSWICPDCGHSNADILDECICGCKARKSNEPESGIKLDTDEETIGFKACPACEKEIPLDDKFCAFCGKSTRVLTENEKTKIRKASKWILAISIMFIIFGTILGFMQRSIAVKAQANLAPYEESHIWETPINGKKYTVGELRANINQEVILVFITNYFLAAVMFGLFLWARKAPFPAMVTALCVYLAVIVNSCGKPA